MNWDTVSKDHYYKGRKAESRARAEGDSASWREFAAFKAGKASYLMAAYGEAQAALAAADVGLARECRKRFVEQCRKGGLVEVAVALGYTVASLIECYSPEESVAWYEAVAELASTTEGERNTLYFAADALDHAAEVSASAGLPFDHDRAIAMWEANAKYWEDRDEEDDAEWSRKRIELHGKLFGLE